jgi:nucleoside-diphosphate-sugar epimerase
VTDQGTRVVVTGSKGEIAAAVLRRLRGIGFTVVALERGDDLAESFRAAAAVIMLDATVSQGGVDYRRALEAVADAVEGTMISRVVAIAIPRANESGQAFLERARAAESAVTFSGPRFTAIHVGFVLGAPQDPAPADAFLFSQEPTIRIPGKGPRRIRPLLLPDLVELVVRALATPDPPAVLNVEGPQEMALKDLMATLNWGPGRKVEEADQHTLIDLVRYMGLFVVMIGVLEWLEVDISIWTVITAGLSTVVYAVFLDRVVEPSQKLPRKTMLLPESERSQALGLPLTRMETVWTESARAARGEQAKRRRSRLSYAALPGSPWIAGFVGTCGVATLGIGLGDLFIPGVTLSGRIAALTLAIAGAVMILGAVALFTRWPSRYVLAFLASIACTVTATALLAASILNGDPPVWTVLGCAYLLIPLSVWCCVRLWRRGGLVVKDILATRGERMLGSVILGGTIVTLGQLLYSAAYLPATATPAVSGDVLLTGEKMPSGVLQATVKLRNASDQPVVILASPFVVDVRKRPAEGVAAGEGTVGTPTARKTATAIVDRDEAFARDTPLEPGQEVIRRIVVAVPRDGYAVASIYVDVVLARKRYRAKTTPARRDLNDGVTGSNARIDDPSLLHRVTRSPRYLHVIHSATALPCPDEPRIVAYVDGRDITTRARWCAGSDRIDEHYGLAHEWFSAQAPIRTTG